MYKKEKCFFTMLLLISVLFSITFCFVGCQPKPNVDNEPKEPKLLMTYTQFENALFDITRYRTIIDGKYALEDKYIENSADSFIRPQKKYNLPESVIANGKEMVETFKDCVLKVYTTKMEFVDADGVVIKSFEISGELTIKNYNYKTGGFRRGSEKEPFIPYMFFSNAGRMKVIFWEVQLTATETQPVIKESYAVVFTI